jgi:hypothetical protein
LFQKPTDSYFVGFFFFFFFFFWHSAIELSIWVGRLARLISEESKELPQALAFSPSNAGIGHKENDAFALKSGIDKGIVKKCGIDKGFELF